MTKRSVKVVGLGLAGLALVVGALVAIASGSFWSRASARYEPADHDFVVPALDDESRAEAERLYLSRGCGECHGADGAGQVMIDAPPFFVAPPNITGVMRTMTPAQIDRLVRRGVSVDGEPIFFMPAHEYARMPDGELGLITAHVRSLAQSRATQPRSELRVVGKVLELLGVLDTPLLPAELIDQDRPLSPAGADEVGEYLAAGCRGCHGQRLSGGPIPGAPEEITGIPSNITPHASGLGAWTEDDFRTALREGRTPERELNPDFMPFRVYRHFTDAEIAALYAYLRTVDPRPFGER